MFSRFACFSIAMVGLASLRHVAGCAEAEEVSGKGGSSGRTGTGGAAGASGAGGSSGAETGGSGGTGTGGSGGSGGPGGSGAVGGSGGSGASAGKGGSGGSAGGRGGSGGSTGGSGGSTGGKGGSTAGSGGVGGVDAGGSTEGGSGIDGGLGTCAGAAAYCNDFERDTAGIMPLGWTRVGGSDGDWQVLLDGSNVFAQNHASSSTFRLCYPNGAAGGPWSGATSVSARVKILAAGSSGTTTALLCLGYSTGGNYACLALEQGSGARVRMNAASNPVDGPLWPASIAVGTWYDVKIGVDAAGAITASVAGVVLGSYTPPSAIAGGYVAVATQSAQAAFDVVMVTQP